MASTDSLFRKYYFSKPGYVSGTVIFHRLCTESISSGSMILEIGAGPANKTSTHLSRIGSVIAADVSEEVKLNQSAKAATVYDGVSLPFGNASFDSCVSDYVIEHIDKPDIHFKEVARVLKPGGVYCFRTPNLWHYVALASLIVPHHVHQLLANPLRSLSKDAHPPYPTRYRANTPEVLKTLCHRAQLEIRTMLMVECEPSYGRSHRMLFLPMMAYERAVNRWSAFDKFRANIFCVVTKPL